MKTKLKTVVKNLKNKGGLIVKTKLKNLISSIIKRLQKLEKILGFVPNIINKYTKGKEDGNILEQLLFLISELKSHIQTWVTVISISIFLYTMLKSGNVEFQVIFKFLLDLI